MSKPPSLLLGVVAGAAGYFFFDPQNGTRRRNTVRDKALKYLRSGREEAVRKADYVAGVAKGAATGAVTSGGEARPADGLDDVSLARKVETEIFRPDDAPKGQVSVNVEEGVVYLRGQLDQPEMIDRLVEEAKKVDGVRAVKNLLHMPGTPAPTNE
jgi:osmotically-inducible protein OsmY